MCILFYLFTLVSLVFINQEIAALSFDSTLKTGFIYIQLSECVSARMNELLVYCALLLRSVCCFLLGFVQDYLAQFDGNAYFSHFLAPWQRLRFESALAEDKCKNT